MNKTTIAALSVAVALGIAAAFVLRSPPPEEMEQLVLPALISDAPQPEDALGLQEKRKPTRDPVGPVNRIEVAGPNSSYSLSKGKLESWTITQPVTALADSTRVRAMLSAFSAEVSSSYSAKIDGKFDKYGLDEGKRIRVTLYKDDELLHDLFVGLVDGDVSASQEADTLVMLPEGDTVFRMKGSDLRSPFDVTVEQLRDKKVFSFSKEEIVRVEIEDPRPGRFQRIVANLETGKEPKPGMPAPTTWKVTEPVNEKLEGLDRLAGDLALLRATEFLPKLPGADASALERPYKLSVTVKPKSGEEAVTTLSIGAGRKGGVYAKVADREEFMLISTTSAENLIKGFNELRIKKIFSFKEADIAKVEIMDPGKPKLRLSRAEKGWMFEEPAGETAYSPRVTSFLELFTGLAVADYLSNDPGPETTGFSEEHRQIKVTLKSGQNVVLHIGKEFKDQRSVEKLYVKLDGSDEVMAAMKYVIKNISKDLDDLRDKRVFRIEQDMIAEITLEHPDQKLVVKEESGKWSLLEPERIEQVDLGATLSTLATLEVSEVVADKTPEEVGLTRGSVIITVRLKDGSSHVLTVSEEVRKDDHYASTTEEHLQGKILLVPKQKVKELLKKLPDFKKEAPVQIPAP